jgi:hypothetical protein
MWLNILLIIVLTLAIIFAVALTYGAFRWDAGTRKMRTRLEASRVPIRPQVVDFHELDGLPTPVERYFRNVLRDGQSMVVSVSMRHSGTFNMSETKDQWKPFSSDQRVVTQRPGFDWDARIAMMPGLWVRVHDAYVAGEGVLHAALFGLFSLANQRGAGDMAEGELMRFFAEAALYPTALLPSQGVRWDAVDDRSALGTLTEGAINLTMLITFNEQGLIDTVRAEARGRLVGGKAVPMPWQCRLWNYGERNEMQVPLDGEVTWMLPEGAKPYFRGHITDIVYEFAR